MKFPLMWNKSCAVEKYKIIEQAKSERTFAHCASMSDHDRSCLQTATEIPPQGHLSMVAALAGTNGVTDESASKTVNLPSHATPQDIYDIFIETHRLGLKNIAVYRDNSKQFQPERL